jgi:hypothetical protein
MERAISGSITRVPDNEDYAELGRLLAAPESWTDAEAAYMQSLVRSQAQEISNCHPRDDKRRKRLEQLQAQLTAAVAQWQAER